MFLLKKIVFEKIINFECDSPVVCYNRGVRLPGVAYNWGVRLPSVAYTGESPTMSIFSENSNLFANSYFYCGSGSQKKNNERKNGGEKSRVSVPLSTVYCTFLILYYKEGNIRKK